MNTTTEPAGNVSFPGGNSSGLPSGNGSPAGFFVPGPPAPGYYHKVTVDIWTYVPPIIISVGTVGNILTIIVILRQIFRISSTSLFLLCLAFSDLLVLYTATLRQWILHNKAWEQKDIRMNSEGSCRAHTFLTYVSIQFSSWLLVAVTIERVISVILPHRIKVISTVKAAVISIVSIAVFLVLLNGHFLFGIGHGYVEEQSRQVGRAVYHKCWPKTSSYKAFYDDALPWIDFLVAFAIPFIILTTCNIIIIVKLASTRKHRRQMSVGSHLKAIERDNKVVTMLLVCLCVVFFICLAPVSIYFIGQPYWIDEITSRPVTSPMVDPIQFLKDATDIRADMEFLMFWHAIVNCFGYLNATCNFIFYVISGSKFRREIFALFCCRRPGRESVFGSRASSRSTAITQTATSTIKPKRLNQSPSEDKAVSELTRSSVVSATTPAIVLSKHDVISHADESTKESMALTSVSHSNIDIMVNGNPDGSMQSLVESEPTKDLDITLQSGDNLDHCHENGVANPSFNFGGE